MQRVLQTPELGSLSHAVFLSSERDSGGGITRLVKASNLKSANITRWDNMLPTIGLRNYVKFALFSRTGHGGAWAARGSRVHRSARVHDRGCPPDDPHPPLLLGRGEDDDHYI